MLVRWGDNEGRLKLALEQALRSAVIWSLQQVVWDQQKMTLRKKPLQM